MSNRIIQNNPETIVFDIETKVEKGRRDILDDEVKIFAYYSYKYGCKGQTDDLHEMSEIINDHKIVVGFNINEYDIPILEHNGVSFAYKIKVDLFKIIVKRATQIKTKKGILNNLLERKSLDFITKILDLVDEETGKMKLSDGWFYNWDESEVALIKEYADRDVDITRKLYEWCENYFWGFRDFLEEKDNRNKSYVKDSLTKVAVKAVCKALGWEEQYNWNVDLTVQGPKIGGGFTAFPAGESYVNKKIHCVDFNSLYTWIMVQCNLFGRHKGRPEDTDRPLFVSSPELRFKGMYYADELSGVSKLQTKWYEDRLELKKLKDPKEYMLKIFLNILYGALDSPWYENLYDKVAANDCTMIGRQFTIHARRMLAEAGYEVIYTDTDSVYLIDNFNDTPKLYKVVDDLMAYIKSLVPFPSHHFGMDDEEAKDPITSMYFFKSKKIDTKDNPFDEEDAKNMQLGLMKKNYIYIKQSGKHVVKNLGMVKKSTSKLSKKIFNEKIIPLIKETHQCKFKKSLIKEYIMEELQKDLSIVALRKDVKPYSYYADTSQNSLPGQISRRYGEGVHSIIVNNKYGAGKKKKYCLLSEFQEMGLRINDLVLENIYNELGYFTIKSESKSLMAFM